MTKTSRTVTIYRPDEDSYIAIFSGTDREPHTRVYRSARELMDDAAELLTLPFPCLCHGREFGGTPRNLLMAISSCEGSTSILMNTAMPYSEAVELFRGEIKNIIKEY